MFESWKKSVLRFLVSRAGRIVCPGCGENFAPFAGREISTFSELNRSPCPACGRLITGNEWSQNGKNPPIAERIPRPPDSRIECRPLGNREWLYLIPRSGKSGGLLFFAIAWNLITGFISFTLLESVFRNSVAFASPALLVLIFPAVGIALLYFALRQKYSTHLLYVSREKIRLERELFGRKKNQDLPFSQVIEVLLTVFYTQNYKPVYGIQIGSGKDAIKFGSALRDDEKQWLGAELRAHLQELRSGN